jgi:hypothetical protein
MKFSNTVPKFVKPLRPFSDKGYKAFGAFFKSDEKNHFKKISGTTQ